MKKFDTINVRGVNFADVDINEALNICVDFIENQQVDSQAAIIHTPNSEIVQMCIDDNTLYDVVNSADIIIPDGIGVILASKILKTPLKKGKVAGVELCDEIMRVSAEKGYKLFFYGGKPVSKEDENLSVAELAAQKLVKKYPGLNIVGTCDGYIKDDAAVIEKIRNSGADVLFVCIGAPKQEKWMVNHRNCLNVKLMGGFGGSLDVFAGEAKRAPKIFIKLGLEWFYRLCKEPYRFVRMMALPKFLFGTMVNKNNVMKKN